MAGETFQRILRVSAGVPGAVDAARVFGNTADGGPGHHVEVRTTASDRGKPAECHLTVRNLSLDSQRIFEDPQTLAIVRAGYRDYRGDKHNPYMRVIFQGNPMAEEIKYARSGGDWTLTVLLRDAGYALDYGRLDVSYGADTSGDQVVSEILRQTGLSRGVIDLGDARHPRRYIHSGPARRALDHLVAKAGGKRRWYVRDGALYILPQGRAVDTEAIVYSSRTGNLISPPERNKDGVMEFTGILDPSLRVGSVVRVESIRVNGFFTLTGVEFSASNGDGDFAARMKGVPRV